VRRGWFVKVILYPVLPLLKVYLELVRYASKQIRERKVTIKFNAKEVFEIAEDIEANGVIFYKTAATMHPKYAELLNRFAEMEEEHRATFASMKQSIVGMDDEILNDPNADSSVYLESIADTHGGEGTPGMATQLTGDESVEEIMDMAVHAEKKSILFYVGLKDMVPESLGRKHVDRIIAEEKQHVITLLNEKAKLD